MATRIIFIGWEGIHLRDCVLNKDIFLRDAFKYMCLFKAVK